MALDLRRPPMDTFHMPSVHPGMFYLPPRPGWVMRPAPAATIRMFAASDSSAVLEMQQSQIDVQESRLLGSVMEINATPVVLTHAEFIQSYVSINGRFWLSGAAGDRIRKKFDVQNHGKWHQERLALAFRQGGFGGWFQPPVWREPSEHLDIAIELRNGFNYYHFTTETLGALAHFNGDTSGRPIHIHLPRDDVRGFMPAFIQAIYPAIADRVRFVAEPRQYDAVRAVYNHRHYLYQLRDERIDAAVSQAVDREWGTLRSDTLARKTVAMASYDSSLRLLREHALRQMPRRLVSGMPNLVWMGRDENGSDARARGLTGDEPLMEELLARGFQIVLFEHLAPLEQVAAMQAADIIVAPHGAGLANMTYARSDTLVIEIGTRQTQLGRWGDFLPSAHVARCTYATVFADVTGTESLEHVPRIAEGHLGIHIGKRATDRILQLIDKDLERRRRKATAGQSAD